MTPPPDGQDVRANGAEPLTPDMPLDAALERLANHGLPSLPVVTEGRVVGLIGPRDALRAYRAAAGRVNRAA